MKKKTALLVSLVLILHVFAAGFAQAATVDDKNITSKGACVMDFDTGEIYYEYNGNIARQPASMTKIMSVYLIYEALEEGEITLDTVVPISRNAYNISRNYVYLPFYYDRTYTVDEMLDIIVVYSSSGAVVAMAELLEGSETAFVKKMNAKATEMGIDAYYKDCYGVALNEITPIGMAKLARNIIKDYPDILKRSAQKSVKFHGNTYTTSNRLLDTYYYEGADGLKTGTTSVAGYCFCGTASRNGDRIIAVTMSSSSTNQRFVDVATLLDYGFKCAEKNRNIKFTDMRTFIDGNEVPTFVYNEEETHSVIVAEDLSRYGFDVNYDEAKKELRIARNYEKPAAPFLMDYYRNKSGQVAYPLADRGIKVIFSDDGNEKILEDVYDIGNYICISVDEFRAFYDFVWNDSERSACISTEKISDGDSSVGVNINGSYEMEFKDQQPVVINDRIMIPVREVFETLEKKVEWNDITRQAIISDESITVKLSPDSDIMIKEFTDPITGGILAEEVILEAVPVIVNGRVLLPVRAVAEAFGMEVLWENETRTVLIITETF